MKIMATLNLFSLADTNFKYLNIAVLIFNKSYVKHFTKFYNITNDYDYGVGGR